MAPSHKKKIYILDTNVILHDSSSIDHFEENDIIIPITVLEELDGFKKNEHEIGYHARQFLRRIDEISGDGLFADGIEIGPGRGKLTIGLGSQLHADLRHNFEKHQSDHQILNIAYRTAKTHENDEVILVTKDVNLRLKAKAVGLQAQNYATDRSPDPSLLYTGKRIEEKVDSAMIDRLYTDESGSVPAAEFNLESTPSPNEYFILRNGKKSALARYDAETESLKHIDKHTAYGIRPRNAEQTFSMDALLNPDIPLVTLAGKAGTGKTLLALASALELKKQYEQILVARPIVPLSNRDSGFLPGEIEEKLAPYMQPLYDNLGVIRRQFSTSDSKHRNIKTLLESDGMVITPLSYIRGRSLVNVFFIVDEGQNLTPHEVKTIITRAGEGTKIVFTGDIYQIDHPYLDAQSNGLSYLIEKMQGQNMYAHITLERGERSVLSELASNLL